MVTKEILKTRLARLFVVLALLLAPPASAQVSLTGGTSTTGGVTYGGDTSPAIALVAHTVAQSTNSNAVTSSAIDTSGASLLVLAINFIQTSGPGTINDSKGNAWVLATNVSAGSGQINTSLYYVKNPTVGSGHTFTGGTTACFCTIFIAAFSGTDTSANVDQSNSATASPVTTLQTGSVTPTTNNQLLVTSIAGASTSAVYSINSSFTVIDTVSVIAGQAYGGALAYLVQGTAGAVNPQWSATGAADTLVTVIDTFKRAP